MKKKRAPKIENGKMVKWLDEKKRAPEIENGKMVKW